MVKYGVFVLGETGRSPRMQYHAYSLSQQPGSEVWLAGIRGPSPHPMITEQKNIHLCEIDSKYWNWLPLRILGVISFLFLAPLKALVQFFVLLSWMLYKLPSDLDYLLVQTPPAIPTLFLVQMICLLLRRKWKLVIDWHNFGYTLLSPTYNSSESGRGNDDLTKGIGNQKQSSGKKKKGIISRAVISIAYMIERVCSNIVSHHHFCVSHAMKEELQKWGIKAIVLYDRPPKIFHHNLTLSEKHDLFMKLHFKESDNVTIFTRKIGQKIELREDRPALVISSTSWTDDEDFGILLDAIVEMDSKMGERKVVFVITGKGDRKEYYVDLISKMKLQNCRIITMWLEASDYPKLIAASDFGVCLHYSSSGVDLPMKVVDMFGSGLPVCAIRFPALPELVIHDQNGLIFDNSKQLSECMMQLLEDFPKQSKKLDLFRSHLINNFHQHRWDDEWNQKAKPVFTHTKIE